MTLLATVLVLAAGGGAPLLLPRPNAKKSAATIPIAATPEAAKATDVQSVRRSSAVR